MSNHLALSHVTAALRSRLALAWQDADPALPGPVTVTSGVPAHPGVADPASINVHLLAVTTSAVNGGVDLPTRGRGGGLVATPMLVVDLTYLLSVHGSAGAADDLLLGLVLTTLHASPALSLQELAAVATGALAASDLHRDGRPVPLVPRPTDLDAVSRIWTMLPAGRYAPSVLWTATGVALSPADSAAFGGPPVRRVRVVLATPPPEVTAVESAERSGRSLVAGADVVVRGRRLVDAGARIDGAAVPTRADGEDLRLTLPAILAPGPHTLRLVRAATASPGAEGPASESDPWPLLVAPEVASVTARTTGEGEDRTTTVRLALTAPVARGQRVAVLLVPADGGARCRLVAPEPLAATTELELTGGRVAAGPYLVVAEVDGVRSALVASTPDGPYDGPAVTVP